MESGEFFLRAILAGLCIGLPAYVVGVRSYSGKSQSSALLATLGFISGATAGLALTAYLYHPTAALLLMLLAGTLNAVALTKLPEIQGTVLRR